VALHNALLGTFLQHPKTRKAEKQTRTISVEVDDQPLVLSYLPLTWYAHQRETLFPGKETLVKGWLFPGGMERHVGLSEATALVETPERALALLFGPVGAVYFEVNRRGVGVRPQYCVVLPEVLNLEEYAEARRLFLRQGLKQLLVAGTSEAAARVLSELEGHRVRRVTEAPGCLVVAFGTTAWSKQQKSRVEVFNVRGIQTDHLHIYRRASQLLPPRLVTTGPDPKTGEIRRFWSIPQTPDLIASNIIRRKPWWRGFAAFWEGLRADAKPNERAWVLSQEQEGLYRMVTDERVMSTGAEARLVQACHEAWRRRLGELSEQARQQGADFGAMALREYERTRISFARCKNAAMLRQTLTDFWSRAGSLPALQEGWPEILPLLHERWQEGRDLALLALASYRSEERTNNVGEQQSDR
jgi:CRISPR-associated protein Cas8a1/Csx13